MRRGKGGVCPCDWLTVIVKMTKVAPIRMLAFWSAIAESWTLIACAVRITLAALAGNPPLSSAISFPPWLRGNNGMAAPGLPSGGHDWALFAWQGAPRKIRGPDDRPRRDLWQGHPADRALQQE